MTSQPMREAEFRFELSRYRKTLLASEDENAKLWKFVNDVESAVDGRIFTTVSRVLVRGAIRDLRASLVTPGTERGEIAYISATLSSYRNELQNLRAAVRAADVVVAIQYGDDPEDIGEETARDLYNEARAKCGEVT